MDSKKKFQEKLGKNIIRLREAKGWSQSDLARHCEKDRQSIERLENGKINPSTYYIYEISVGLGVPLKELIDF